MRGTTSIVRLFTACAVLLTLTPGGVVPTALAQENEAAAQETTVSPTTKIKVSAAKLRTLEAMEAAEATMAAPVADSGEPLRFRPTMDEAEYRAAKAAAANFRSLMLFKPGAEEMSPLMLAPPTLKTINVNGASQAGLIPPDTHGAVGTSHFVEVTNSRRTVLRKSDGVILSNVSLASFFGYTATDIFDPRAVFDPVWKRFVITAEARPESATVQRFFIAVSQSSNALGSYFIYNLDINIFNNDNFFDFPQLGFDQDSIIITANIFGPSAFREAWLLAIAKARVYNGLGFSVPVFTGLGGTQAPPIVLDQNGRAFIAQAPNGGSAINIRALTNSSRPNLIALGGPVAIPVGAYALPPDARQPTPCNITTHLLDTSDNRFVNACTQTGDSLFCVHTIALGSFPAPRYYELNTATNSVIRSNIFFASGTSDDFNPSIAADASLNMVVTWSVTDRPAGTNAQVRFGGRRSFDATGIGAGTALFTSPTCITGNFDPNFGIQRWGDYSAVSLDPSAALRFWIVNEKINSSSAWGSRVAKVGF